MDKYNSDKEILEFAIHRENEAYNLYKALAGRVAAAHIKKLLEILASEELEHKSKLELEIIKTGRTVSTEPETPRPANEYILSDSSEPLDMDYKDVLMLGITKEDAAFRTYVNLISIIHDEQSREVLFALAEEEIKHKIRFETEYKIVQKNTRNQE